MKNSSFIVLSILTIFILGGCSAVTGHKQAMTDFDNMIVKDKCNYEKIDDKIKLDDDVVLWGEQGGTLARNCFNYKKSIELFDKAEESYKASVDKDSTLKNIVESTASVLVNNNVNDYEGNTYEKVMINTYKALNFSSLNDHANARIEFNRALDRQRRAKEFFKKEIKKREEELKAKKESEQKKQIEKEKQAKNKNDESFDLSKAIDNKKTNDTIYKSYDDIFSNFKAYPDFVNPFTTYISGVYFLLNGDAKKGRSLLKESYHMNPKNSQIKSDYLLSKKYANSKAKYAWIIYENGQGMIKDEINVHVPLFLFTKKVNYTGIALPKIKERSESYTYLTIQDKKTVEICNMDNVIKTEFQKRLPLIVTEAVFNTVIKTWTQYEMQKTGGLVAGLVGTVYQGATNKADVRTWTSLPKTFQSTRVKLTGKPISIKDNNGKLIKSIIIPKNKSAMIYVKSDVQGHDKIHEILF